MDKQGESDPAFSAEEISAFVNDFTDVIYAQLHERIKEGIDARIREAMKVYREEIGREILQKISAKVCGFALVSDAPTRASVFNLSDGGHLTEEIRAHGARHLSENPIFKGLVEAGNTHLARENHLFRELAATGNITAVSYADGYDHEDDEHIHFALSASRAGDESIFKGLI